jgi:2-polyprenyl-3-methyl-5-hydroxy-6-metoxy-1,4-benzoquinol methylase
VDSREPGKSLPEQWTRVGGENMDLCICSDVIEHIYDPDDFYLMKFLLSLDCSVYIVSTPKRDVMGQDGPPVNTHHVLEWNFHELQQAYMTDQGFRVVRAMDGSQHDTTQFVVAVKS